MLVREKKWACSLLVAVFFCVLTACAVAPLTDTEILARQGIVLKQGPQHDDVWIPANLLKEKTFSVQTSSLLARLCKVVSAHALFAVRIVPYAPVQADIVSEQGYGRELAAYFTSRWYPQTQFIYVTEHFPSHLLLERCAWNTTAGFYIRFYHSLPKKTGYF